MEFERDSDDVAINKVTISPSVVSCSATVNFAVDLQNVGTDDQDSVQVRLKESELGVDLSSEVFSLNEFDDSGDTALESFTFKVPSNAKPGDYFVETIIFFGSRSTTSLDKLTVRECQVFTPQDIISLTQTSFTATQGSVFTIPLTLKNPGTQPITYTVDVTADSWADVAGEEVVTVAAGEQTTAYVYLTPRPSLPSGEYTAALNVKQNDRLLTTQNVKVSVGSQGITGGTTYQPSVTAASVWRNLAQSTAFWIAAVVIVFTLVVYVLSALLRPK